MKIVITGATGQIGRNLSKQLNVEKNEIILIGRDASKLVNEKTRGATILEGNMLDLKFMTKALAGADVYFFLPPPNFTSEDMVSEYSELAKISREAAIAGNVKRIVHLSTLGTQIDDKETGLIFGQRQAEIIIREAAPNVIHFRNGLFLENYLGATETIGNAGQIYFPVSSNAKYPVVATADIAKIARDLIENPKWEGKTILEYQGQDDMSFAEIASEIGKGLGRQVEHVAVPSEAAIETMTEMGLSKAYASDLVKIFTSIDSGLLKAEFTVNDENVRIGGISVSEFAKQAFPSLIS